MASHCMVFAKHAMPGIYGGYFAGSVLFKKYQVMVIGSGPEHYHLFMELTVAGEIEIDRFRQGLVGIDLAVHGVQVPSGQKWYACKVFVITVVPASLVFFKDNMGHYFDLGIG